MIQSEHLLTSEEIEMIALFTNGGVTPDFENEEDLLELNEICGEEKRGLQIYS